MSSSVSTGTSPAFLMQVGSPESVISASLLSVLVQIYVDPYYRTPVGFYQLLLKDFFGAGYVLILRFSNLAEFLKMLASLIGSLTVILVL